MQLDGRQTQMLSNVAVLDGQHLINGLALDPVPANGTLLSILTSTASNSQCNADAASIELLTKLA